MSITINGSGTIGGLSAGGLPDGSITTADLNSAVPVAKAWVNFNGTGTVAIRASYNVSSITDNGTGEYTVNFTTAMADANYAVSPSAGGTPGTVNLRPYDEATARTASAIKLICFSTTFSALDSLQINVAIFR